MLNFLIKAWSILLPAGIAAGIAIGWLLSNWHKTLQIRELRGKLSELEKSRAKADSRIYLPTNEEIERYKFWQNRFSITVFLFLSIGVLGLIVSSVRLSTEIKEKETRIASLELQVATAGSYSQRIESERLELQYGSRAEILNGQIQLYLSPFDRSQERKGYLKATLRISGIGLEAKSFPIVLRNGNAVTAPYDERLQDGKYGYKIHVRRIDRRSIALEIERTMVAHPVNVQQ